MSIMTVIALCGIAYVLVVVLIEFLINFNKRK